MLHEQSLLIVKGSLPIGKYYDRDSKIFILIFHSLLRKEVYYETLFDEKVFPVPFFLAHAE